MEATYKGTYLDTVAALNDTKRKLAKVRGVTSKPMRFSCGAGAITCDPCPQDEDTLYGLCELGIVYRELGYVRLSELQSMTMRVPPAAPSA